MIFQCCFCGSSIVDKLGTIEIAVRLEDEDAFEGLYCHSACLTNALHPSVPTVFAGLGTIFIPIQNEGTDVWRPVWALKVERDYYQIPASAPIPDDEDWPFEPGSTVRCEIKTFQDGSVGLVAVAKV